MHLLLIDQHINDIDKVINSVNEETCCLVFNSNLDSIETILSKVKFLNHKNRLIIDRFFYTQAELEENIPTQIISLQKTVSDTTSDQSGVEHCTPCDDFDMTSVHVKPEDVYSALINESMGVSSDSSIPTSEYSLPSVFFQRFFRTSSKVMITDLDEIYQIGIQFGELSELDIPLFSSVGIMQHSQPNPTEFKFLNTLTNGEAGIVLDVDVKDPDLVSWTFFINFIRSLYTTYYTTVVDLMACAIYSNPGWKYVIDTIGDKIGNINNNDVYTDDKVKFTIRASSDNTGSASLGGNWIMETSSVDLTTVYFTTDIYKWKYVLATYIDRTFKFYRWNNEYAYRSSQLPEDNVISLRDKTYTVTFWYYEEKFETNCSIVDRGDYEFTIQVHNEYTTDKKGIAIAPGSDNFEIIANNSTVPTAVWTHIAVVRDKSIETRYKIYINGELTDSYTTTSNEGTAGANNTTFAVGMQSPVSCMCNKLKTGVYLYDLCIYNTAKTKTEIRMLRNRLNFTNFTVTGKVFNTVMYHSSDTSSNFVDACSGRNLTINGYSTDNWKNTSVPIPNIGILIHNGSSLVNGIDSSGQTFSLNGTHFGNINYTDFRGLDLSSVNFSGGSTMLECDFSGTALTNVSFFNVNLSDSTFDSAYGGNILFDGALLRSCSMKSSRFTTSSFTDTILDNAKLNNANFSNSTFTRTNLNNSDLSGAILHNVSSSGVTATGTKFPTNYFLSSSGGFILGPHINFNSKTYNSTNDLSGRILTDVQFNNAVLESNDMTNTNFTRSIFTGCSLKNSNLSSSVLTSTNFIDATLTNTNFTSCILKGVVSKGITNSSGIILPSGYKIIGGYIIGSEVNVSNTNLQALDMSGMNLTGVSFNSSDLSGAILTNTSFDSDTNFSNSTLSYIKSGRIIGLTTILPSGYKMI